MSQNIYHILWLFITYSFLGWITETIIAAAKQKRFVNRGLIDGPFCVLYGFATVLMTIGLKGTYGIWLFIGCCIYAALIEWIAGHLIEHFFHERWWNHSNVRWNLDGYICLPYTVIWGLVGFFCIRRINTLLINLYDLLPAFFGIIIILLLIFIIVWDALASYILITKKSGRLDRWEAANNRFVHIAAHLGNWISERAVRRIQKAYNSMDKSAQVEATETFAEGCGFYKVVMLFFIGAFLGDIVETIFCRITAGVWMSRSSVIWGPFSIVWGLAISMVTLLLYKYRNHSDRFLFLTGTLLGGVYEYFCSVFTEIIFGTVFWDYSDIPFNLAGRINLLFCFFWGFAAVIWFKHIYPVLSRLIEKIPVIAGKIVTWLLIIFMCCNIIMSSLALTRYNQRQQNIEDNSYWQTWMDNHYNDSKIERIYPNAITVKTSA